MLIFIGQIENGNQIDNASSKQVCDKTVVHYIRYLRNLYVVRTTQSSQCSNSGGSSMSNYLEKGRGSTACRADISAPRISTRGSVR